MSVSQTKLLAVLDRDVAALEKFFSEEFRKLAARREREATQAQRRTQLASRYPDRVPRRPLPSENAVTGLPSDGQKPRIRWKGADVIVADLPLPNYQGSSALVVTVLAAYVARILRRLVGLKLQSVTWLSKLEFYGEIAVALQEKLPADRRDRELAARVVFDSARRVLLNWRERVVQEGR